MATARGIARAVLRPARPFRSGHLLLRMFGFLGSSPVVTFSLDLPGSAKVPGTPNIVYVVVPESFDPPGFWIIWPVVGFGFVTAIDRPFLVLAPPQWRGSHTPDGTRRCDQEREGGNSGDESPARRGGSQSSDLARLATSREADQFGPASLQVRKVYEFLGHDPQIAHDLVYVTPMGVMTPAMGGKVAQVFQFGKRLLRVAT